MLNEASYVPGIRREDVVYRVNQIKGTAEDRSGRAATKRMHGSNFQHRAGADGKAALHKSLAARNEAGSPTFTPAATLVETPFTAELDHKTIRKLDAEGWRTENHADASCDYGFAAAAKKALGKEATHKDIAMYINVFFIFFNNSLPTASLVHEDIVHCC